MLLFVLPSLLMPPGVCICQRAGEERAAQVRVPEAAPDRMDDGLRSPGCCKRCRATPPPATPPQTAAAETGTPTPRPPADRDHAPTCPAAGLTATAKYVEPPVVLFGLQLATVAGPSNPGCEPHGTLGVSPDGDRLPTAPLYITFRSLLI